jgi:DNA-binding transcriptional LysR family regulator
VSAAGWIRCGHRIGNAFREKPAGHLRLTMPPPVARFVLAPVLARFSRLYPEIVIEATVESGFTDIVAGRYDAGFRRGNLVARDMIATRVSSDMHYLVVASPDYLARLRTGSEVRPQKFNERAQRRRVLPAVRIEQKEAVGDRQNGFVQQTDQTPVGFGTSFGVSTLHLAAALRDNGGGKLITGEFEPAKIARARAN